MRVDRDGAAYREDVGGLHRLDGEARMNHVLDVVPRGPGTNGDCRAFRMDLDLIEATHVQHDPATAKGLPTHAVAYARGRDREPGSASIGQRIGNLSFGIWLNDAGDRCPVEAARIVHASAFLRPGGLV